MSLLAQLNTLESTGLVRLAVVQPELAYLFRHALGQDAAYGSLLKRDRRQLHLVVGEALEQLYPDQHAEQAATLPRARTKPRGRRLPGVDSSPLGGQWPPWRTLRRP